jgi:hypothetical protein
MMSRRLQILLDEREYKEIQRAARAQRVTVAEWVRQALRARLRQPKGDHRKKLDVIQAAIRHSFPSGDVSSMLGEVERGYLGRDAR